MQKYHIKNEVMFDPNVMADIEDLSDCDKVSLISDIELPDQLAVKIEPDVTDVVAQGGDTAQDLQFGKLD